MPSEIQNGSSHTATTINPPSRETGPPSVQLPLPYGSRLSLKQAISIALKYHPRAAEAAAESGAAQQRVGEARAYLGPQVYGLSEYLRSTDNGIGNTSFYNVDGVVPRISGSNHDLPANDFSQSWNTSNNYLGGAMISQYLLDFGRRRGFIAQRRFESKAAAEQQLMVDLQLIFTVSQRYFNVLETRQLVRVYEKAVEERQYHLHEAQVKANTGLRPQLDVYVTQAEVQRAQLHLLDARNAEQDAVVAFDNSLGLGGSSPNYQLIDVLTYSPVTEQLNSLIRDAVSLRPDMKALVDQARAMGARITEYRSDYFPTVNGVAGYSAIGTGLPAVNNFNVGLVISWPIFNSFLTTHQIAEARYEQRAIQEQIDDLRQHILLQVKTAFLDWQASVQRITRAKQTLEASRVELELAEKRYTAGLADVVELQDAQRNYTADDAAYANALYGYSVAKAAVDQATARSLSG
ncbi:MAG TPA: TolC family protein [Candidatus Binataceae bacterium]|nr:TolC family protein [Candidatus Binataceae bacterium]